MKVFFFGDSICFGQYVSPHKTWVTQIARELDKLPGGENIQVMNASVNGNTTRMALERMPYDVQSHSPDIILIQFGVNDCNYWKTDGGHPRVSKMGFKANLIEIIERSRIFGAKEIFLNTNNPSPKTSPFDYAPLSFQQSNEEFNQIIREVAKVTHVNLIDIEKYWLEQFEKGLRLQDLLLPDNIHLSIQGHNLYFEIVYPYIEKALNRLLRIEAQEKK